MYARMSFIILLLHRSLYKCSCIIHLIIKEGDEQKKRKVDQLKNRAETKKGGRLAQRETMAPDFYK
jgi:hypothetical protein